MITIWTVAAIKCY